MSVEGKVALVTGASRGIGAAIADQLAQQGALVVGTATTAAGADAISDRLRALGVAGEGRVLDVTSADSVAELLGVVSERHGAPLILVNNAGITRDNLLMRMKDDEWNEVIDTNLTAVYRITKGCLRGMTRARWGRIITISSIVGSMGNPGQVNYCATKSGVEGFSRSLASEISSRGITVNCVAPGFIDTAMTQALPDAQREALLGRIAAGRLGQPEEVAAVVGFLASAAAGYITGETIHVNGGMYMS